MITLRLSDYYYCYYCYYSWVDLIGANSILSRGPSGPVSEISVPILEMIDPALFGIIACIICSPTGSWLMVTDRH